MGDIRTRLADALRDQFRAPPLQLDYAAGVLLSLPGIAIIELPESPDFTYRNGDQCWRGDEWSVVSGSIKGVEIRSYIGISIADARALAAALLAAANAAEQAANHGQ